MNIHDLLSGNRAFADVVTFLCAGVAVVSLSQAALMLTIVSTVIAIILGAIRIHDRIAYGPAKGRGE